MCREPNNENVCIFYLVDQFSLIFIKQCYINWNILDIKRYSAQK